MPIIDYDKISRSLFFDIETVSEFKSYTELNETTKLLWDKVSKRYLGNNYEDATVEECVACYYNYAPLHAEFCKIVCIGWGIIKIDLNDLGNSIKHIQARCEDDEEKILRWFVMVITEAYNKNTDRILCGHNIGGFDVPLLIKRLLKYGIKIPTILLNIQSEKPWNQNLIDTMRVWKFGGTEFVGLESICNLLNIPSSKKGAVTGKGMNDFFWNGENINHNTHSDVLTDIKTYCMEDVDAVINLAMFLAKC